MKDKDHLTSEVEQQFGERVVRIETDLNSFKDEVRGELRGLSGSVRGLTEAIQRQGRPNWQVWIGFMGLIFALVGGGMVFVDMRIETRVQPIAISQANKLIEVETQFSAEAQIQNLQHDEQHRINAMLWNAGALGKLSKYPEAPYSHPNVSQKGTSE